MKGIGMVSRPLLSLLLLLVLGATAEAASIDLRSIVPQEPLLVLKAKRFADHFAQARASSSVETWLKGAAGKRYLSSRLHLKLRDRFKDWGKSLGLGITFDRVAELAGDESLLALYDVGDLRFCFLGRIPEARWKASQLAAARADFEVLTVAGGDVHVKRAGGGAVTLAVAWRKGVLVAANRLDVFTDALEALEGSAKGSFLRPGPLADGWRREEEASADFLLWLDQARINRDGYFQSYWIGRRPSELAWIEGALIALHLREEGMEERRLFLGSVPEAMGTTTSDLALLRARLPERAELRRVEAVRGGTGTFHRLAELFWKRRLQGEVPSAASATSKLDALWAGALDRAAPRALAYASRAGKGARGVLPRRERVALVALKEKVSLDGALTALAECLGLAMAGRRDLLKLRDEADGIQSLRDPLTGSAMLLVAQRPGMLFLADDEAFLKEALRAVSAGPLRPEKAVSLWWQLDLSRLRSVAKGWFATMGAHGGSGSHWVRRIFSDTVVESLEAFDGIGALESNARPVPGGLEETLRYGP